MTRPVPSEPSLARLLLARAAVRVAAIALALGLLYGLVLLERFVLAVIPTSASTWWMEHPNVQPLVDIPLALAALAGVIVPADRALRKLAPPAP